jgi:hypothetical protein
MRKFSVAACHWSIISRHTLCLFRQGVYDCGDGRPFAPGSVSVPVAGPASASVSGTDSTTACSARRTLKRSSMRAAAAPRRAPPAAKRIMKKPKTEPGS